MIGLTRRQREVLDYIQAYISEKSLSPSVGEVAAYFAISPPSALMHLRALQKKKLIRRTSRARSIVIVKPDAQPSAAPMFCAVPCYASPESLENNEVAEKIFISPDLISSETFQQVYAVRAEEKIVAEGILSGDFMIARRQSTAADGEFVLAVIGGKLAAARCVRDGKQLWINRLGKRVTDAKIVGRIIALQRNY